MDKHHVEDWSEFKWKRYNAWVLREGTARRVERRPVEQKPGCAVWVKVDLDLDLAESA